jgi:hypothetical protein
VPVPAEAATGATIAGTADRYSAVSGTVIAETVGRNPAGTDLTKTHGPL